VQVAKVVSSFIGFTLRGEDWQVGLLSWIVKVAPVARGYIASLLWV
jgi:hypothetical protein